MVTESGLKKEEYPVVCKVFFFYYTQERRVTGVRYGNLPLEYRRRCEVRKNGFLDQFICVRSLMLVYGHNS